MTDRADWLLPVILAVLAVLALCLSLPAHAGELEGCLRDRADRTERLVSCLDETDALEQERDRLRVALTLSEQERAQERARTARAVRRRRAALVTGLVVGSASGVALTAGAVHLAGRL